MSKAAKNTTKARQSNAAAVKEMRAKLAALTAKQAEAAAAFDAYTAADRAAGKVANSHPHPVPVHQRQCPPEVEAAFNALTTAELAAMPKDNLYFVWQTAQRAAYTAELSAYQADRDRAKIECGLVAAEKRLNTLQGQVSRLAQQIIRTKAHGVEAIAIKLQAIRIAEFGDHQMSWLGGFIATIEDTAAEAGFNTRAPK